MAYVPGFSNDIFISYSHIDDQAVEGPGWVSDFHRRLLIEVEEELGESVHIWRDKRITGATDFTKDLEKQVRGSAMLLAILSPGYVNSRWCDWELTGFAGSHRIGDLWVDTKCRAIKIFKRPADVSGLRVLAEAEGVKFFDVDRASDTSYELDGSSELSRRRLTELGHDIGFVLRTMRKSRTVFLGTASATLRDQRERVRQELEGRRYRILTVPEGSPDECRVRARSSVRDSALSILFHDRTAAPAEHPADASATLERQVAMDERARQVIVVHGLPEVASQPWDEPGATGQGSAKVDWLIEPATHTLYHTVLQMLQAPDDLTSPAPDSPPEGDLGTPRQPAPAPAPTPQDPARSHKLVRVYLICDHKDHPLLESNRARHLRDHLLGLGFEVRLPLAEEHDPQFSHDNRTKLKQCDAVLLYWGTAPQSWFDKRIGELEKARGWRRDRAFTALGAYFADPQNLVKQNYETREVDELIKQFDAFDLSDAKLVRFVQRLGQAT